MSGRGLRPLRFLVVLACLALVPAACGSPDPALSQPAAAAAQPAAKILFAQKGDIYEWDGSSIHQLTKLGDASYPRWSSDGSQFVFVRSGDAYSDIWTANADGSALKQLTRDQPTGQIGTLDYVNNAVWALDPVWSRAGDDIAFVSDRGTPQNYVWLIRGVGSNAVRVPGSTVNGDNVEHPDFSPDGKQLVFAQRVQSQTNSLDRWTQIWKVDLTTGQLSPVVKTDSGSFDPAWSPDGKWIAYVGRTGTADDLWVIPAQGSGQAVKLTSTGNVVSPTWAPDGSGIAFLQTDGVTFQASYISFSVDASGAPQVGKVQNLFTAPLIDAVSGLSWAP